MNGCWNCIYCTVHGMKWRNFHLPAKLTPFAQKHINFLAKFSICIPYTEPYKHFDRMNWEVSIVSLLLQCHQQEHLHCTPTPLGFLSFYRTQKKLVIRMRNIWHQCSELLGKAKFLLTPDSSTEESYGPGNGWMSAEMGNPFLFQLLTLQRTNFLRHFRFLNSFRLTNGDLYQTAGLFKFTIMWITHNCHYVLALRLFSSTYTYFGSVFASIIYKKIMP